MLGGRVIGNLTGKHALFHYGLSKEGTICAGVLIGNGVRFCCKRRLEGRSHCGITQHDRAKFKLESETYYAPMDNESARVFPFVQLVDLERTEKLGLVTDLCSSKEWVEVLNDFLIEHDLMPDFSKVSSEAKLPPREKINTSGPGGANEDDLTASVGDYVSLGSEFGTLMEGDLDSADGASSPLTKVASAAPSSDGSSSVLWGKMRPANLWDSSLPRYPEELWHPHMEATHSIEQILVQFPLSFNNLRTKIEEECVTTENVHDVIGCTII